MEEFLYHPDYISEIIFRKDITIPKALTLLNTIWEEENIYLLPKHREDKRKFIKSVMETLNLITNYEDLDAELEAIENDLNAIGAEHKDYDAYLYSYICHRFIDMRINILYLGKQSHTRMKLRNFLAMFGYKRRNNKVLAHMKKCLEYYNIEVFERGKVPCDIKTADLDSMVTFRVLNNLDKAVHNTKHDCEVKKSDVSGDTENDSSIELLWEIFYNQYNS